MSLAVAAVMWSLGFLDLSVYVLLPLQCVCGLTLAIFIYERLKLEEYIEVKSIAQSVFNRIYKHG